MLCSILWLMISLIYSQKSPLYTLLENNWSIPSPENHVIPQIPLPTENQPEEYIDWQRVGQDARD